VGSGGGSNKQAVLFTSPQVTGDTTLFRYVSVTPVGNEQQADILIQAPVNIVFNMTYRGAPCCGFFYMWLYRNSMIDLGSETTIPCNSPYCLCSSANCVSSGTCASLSLEPTWSPSRSCPGVYWSNGNVMTQVNGATVFNVRYNASAGDIFKIMVVPGQGTITSLGITINATRLDSPSYLAPNVTLTPPSLCPGKRLAALAIRNPYHFFFNFGRNSVAFKVRGLAKIRNAKKEVGVNIFWL
jgi:hypothetical protein